MASWGKSNTRRPLASISNVARTHETSRTFFERNADCDRSELCKELKKQMQKWPESVLAKVLEGIPAFCFKKKFNDKDVATILLYMLKHMNAPQRTSRGVMLALNGANNERAAQRELRIASLEATSKVRKKLPPPVSLPSMSSPFHSRASHQ